MGFFRSFRRQASQLLPLLLGLVIGLASTGLRAQQPTEAEVKAALVAKVAAYTEWPEKVAPRNQTIICVAGRGPTVDSLRNFDGRTVYGRNLSIVPRLRHTDAGNCHILFIGETANRNPDEWLLEVADLPVLTIGDSEEFTGHGGIIGLYRDDNHRVSMEVNLSAMRRAGVRLSAHLLKLVRTYGR
ncbi:MAG: hypothetical protein RIR00_1545 [Pseudomonadota bacterium]